MAIYRISQFKSSLIPGLIAALFLAPLSNVLAQQTDNTASEQDVFVGDNKSTYGPIKASDTLWKIANAYRPDSSVTNYQVMVALFKTNPNAFVNNDINFLIQGQYLRIPTLEQINKVVPFHRQNDSDSSLNRINNAIASNIKSETGEVVAAETTAPNTQVATLDPVSAPDTESVTAQTEPAITESVATNTKANPELESAKADSNEEPSVSQDSASSELANASTETSVLGLTLEGVEEEATEPAPAQPQVSNSEVEESLAAVGVKLDDLQYELERSKQNQAELDQKLEEQNVLLLQSKKREQRLMAEQEALKKRNAGVFNSPVAYWSVIGLLFVLFAVLTVMVQRRRRVEKELLALKPEFSANKQSQTIKVAKSTPVAKAKAINSKTDVTEKSLSTRADSRIQKNSIENIKDASVLQPSAVLFDGGINKDEKNELNSNATDQPVSATKARDPLAEAFAKVELKESHVEPDELVSEADFLANLVKNEANDTLDNDLNMDHIIEDMVDEDTKAKPAKLHSDSQFGNGADLSSSQLKEIDDFNDVEFDKLLEEISSESEHMSFESAAESTSTQVEDSNALSTHSNHVGVSSEQDFVEIEDIIADSESSEEYAEPYQEGKIDVGLDEFPEFTQNVNPVNVDDDKHGVNAKLDLAQVYIEIGDEDNAAVILKNVMKLGNSSQQQQAQQLLYSLKS
ncbi:hypothetical protein FE810_13065 [Thalassotalea litorea]|uniref:LysM domain-containing protein n=1 Tax=Thalassotalea litorea TaxID=2020715 RepID=A0A5R9ILU2_9GAMM|nr:FimV/HubP family polar landmark protein [Thalassotalea litorea]TLU64221.1 hypothetical protein FE810_13065 [Thalassotalea litorea]